MSIEREVIEHGVKLVNISTKLDELSERLEPIFNYVVEDKERERLRQGSKGYWELIKSGSIAAIVGAITAWLMGGGNASP